MKPLKTWLVCAAGTTNTWDTCSYRPVNVVFCANFADGRNHAVKPPHSISLDGSYLILKRPQDLQIWNEPDIVLTTLINIMVNKYIIGTNTQHLLFFSPLSHAMPASLTWAVMPNIMETVSKSVTWITKRSYGRDKDKQFKINCKNMEFRAETTEGFSYILTLNSMST